MHKCSFCENNGDNLVEGYKYKIYLDRDQNYDIYDDNLNVLVSHPHVFVFSISLNTITIYRSVEDLEVNGGMFTSEDEAEKCAKKIMQELMVNK